MSIESVMPSNHLILGRPLLLPPSIVPKIRVFSSESVLCIRWPKYWSFSCTISPSNEYSRMISFRMDWLDLPAVQETLKSLLQHHSSKASIFSTQLSLQSNSQIRTWLRENPQLWLDGPLLARQTGSGPTGDGKSEHNIIVISELKWTVISNFNSDDRIYYCCQKSLRRNEVALLVNKRVRCSTWVLPQKQQNDLCSFPKQTIQHHSNPRPRPNR